MLAGTGYILNSQISAKAIRNVLKTEVKANAEKTVVSTVKMVNLRKK
uniref:Uncharacterized protein n=1 Tax=Rhinolophus ferrumequinum TaxID=59479 RepID=A0A671DSZ9_RHIFE